MASNTVPHELTDRDPYEGWTVVKFDGGSVLLDGPGGDRRRVSLEPEADRLADEVERLRGVARRVVSFTATCRTRNTEEWMDLLVETLNETLEEIGELQRVVRDRDMLRFTRPEAE